MYNVAPYLLFCHCFYSNSIFGPALIYKFPAHYTIVIIIQQTSSLSSIQEQEQELDREQKQEQEQEPDGGQEPGTEHEQNREQEQDREQEQEPDRE